MVERIEQLIELFERKQIDRRHLIGALLIAASARAASGEAADLLFDGRGV
jgi:hypothetical protein